MNYYQNQNVNSRSNIPPVKSFAKADVNFLCLPYFCLYRKPDADWMLAFTEKHQQGHEFFEAAWTVIPNPDFGLPGDFERKLHRTVEFCLSRMQRPIQNPVPLPGFRELARIMEMQCSGKFVRRVKQGLITMMNTEIRSIRSYYSKSRKTWIEESFHLYEKVIFAGELLPDRRKADRNFVYFYNAYLDNINTLYVRPLDFDYLKSLSPVAARLYELLGVKFYGHNEYIQYRYSTLIRLLAIPRKKNLSRSRRQLEAAHDELKQTCFLSHCEWIPIQGEKHDWYIRYVPGERFFSEAKLAKSETASYADMHPTQQTGKTPDGSRSSADPIKKESGQTLPLFPSENEPASLWLLFSGIVKKYPEFALWPEDREWFRLRIEMNNAWQSLDLREEIENWGDWLDTEYRKKIHGNNNKFPRSNFKGNLKNWLKQSLRFLRKENDNSLIFNENKHHGQKGWDLPSDYRLDIM